MTAYTYTMSNDKTEVIPAVPAVPAVPTRRSILHRPPEGGAHRTSPFAGWRGQAPTEELAAVPRVSTPAKPTGSRWARHLRAAVTGIALAAALLTGLQLYAAAGIADARQAALAQQARPAATATQHDEGEAPAPQWLIEGTPVDAPSPLDLPRCTTSPDTPSPCLATISPSQDRAVVLEEDASLTALVRR